MANQLPAAERISGDLRQLWKSLEAVSADGLIEEGEMVLLVAQYEPLQDLARRKAIADRVAANMTHNAWLDDHLAADLPLLRRGRRHQNASAGVAPAEAA